QFHFHRPSEERIDGRQFDMAAHLVHKDLAGRMAVVAVLLERGGAHPLVQSVWNNLPLEKGDEVSARALLDLHQLLPRDTRYFTYMGSLTTPPCSEGVLWMVMQQPVSVSPEQIDVFSRLYPMNARPLQQASGRLIKQSN
ncbi:MAG TPA: carbonic anhydrase family protein, partial [Burkholderiaceae bacterium]|nr:carbonic anhydrase family protein [Burkholderiaceae bacterium]